MTTEKQKRALNYGLTIRRIRGAKSVFSTLSSLIPEAMEVVAMCDKIEGKVRECYKKGEK